MRLRLLTERGLSPEAAAKCTDIEIMTPNPALGAPGTDLRGVHAIIISALPQINAEFLERAPDLRVVGRPGIGIDNVDVEACTAAGVLVVHTPEAPSESTAEHAVALIFAVARKLKQADYALRTNGWEDRDHLMGLELRGKTLGLVGMGRIGGRVAHMMGVGVGMRVLGFDPYVGRERAEQLGVEPAANLGQVLREADILTVHSPLTRETRQMIGAAELAQMKPGALLVNCSRGAVLDEAALIEALRSGHLGGAGLDVFDPEPPMPDNPLLAMPNVIVTAHIASFTREGMQAMRMGIIEEVLSVLRGQRPRWMANPQVWPGRAG